MKNLFSQSGQVFSQFLVFEAILRLVGFFLSFKNSLWTFYCTQNECLNAMVSMQNWFKKWATPGRDIWEKQNVVAIWFCVPCLNFFTNISAQGGPFFKPIFSLKAWDQNGCFEYNNRYKWSFWISKKKFPRASKISLKALNCEKIWPDWEKRLFI